MYSSKKNILQTVALLKAHGISHVVLSPGSRNAPLTQSFACDPFFICHSIVDERSAGYFAIGLINRLQKPVILCCTSGTALLNYGPAVAEAYYQELPLIVVSADRSPAWIGEMDGQTLPQPGAFRTLVKKSVQLPEIQNEEDLWHCNRLVNEAILACKHHGSGPVHINVPVSEPLFDFSTDMLPEVRCIKSMTASDLPDMQELISIWKSSSKRMILVGQMQPNDGQLSYLLEKMAFDGGCIVLAEHLSNIVSSTFIGNFDALISALNEKESENLAPELLITIGGHIVSKQIKKFIRNHQPANHWHISPSGNIVDTMMCLTYSIESEPAPFFEKFSDSVSHITNTDYARKWLSASKAIYSPKSELPFSDITVAGAFLERIPDNSVLFAGNSSAIRNIQLYSIPASTYVFCNRGTNGIEGSVSTACGYATESEALTFLLVGDLSFFYDLNALWNKHFPDNLRILLVNNGGGGIFHLLPDLDKAEALEEYVSAHHETTAEGWVQAAGLKYLKAETMETLHSALTLFTKPSNEKAMVLEVFTTPENNKSTSDNYYNKLKHQ